MTDPLKPQDHAERVAHFRAQLLGPLLVGELDRGALRAGLAELSQKLVRPPDSPLSRRYSKPTLERWYYRYRQGGVEALRPAPRRDRGAARALTKAQRKLLLDIRREYPRASAELILRTLASDGRLPANAPSAPTVRRLFAEHGLDRLTLRRTGKTGRVRRRWQAEAPGVLWHADVCHGPTLTSGDTKLPVRIHAILDDASRHIMAIEVCDNEREIEMLRLMVRALRRGPRPDALYLDNGSTYSGDTLATAGRRAADLTRQLLAFSRKQILEPEVTSLKTVVHGIEGMLRRLLGEDIDIAVHLERALGNVMADPGQMEQVLMNLAVNARDALERGGQLTIETRNVELDEEYAAQHTAVTPGPYVSLAVTDSGSGMSDETRRSIFEPFFTTKEKGKGTGLGLAMVHGIVTQSGGNIWVYSELGHGTTFKIYLPRVDTPVAACDSAPPRVAVLGDETLLLVEDDAAVRRAAERILQVAGYHVLTAASGDEALGIAERHAGEIRLLLTDVVMPGMSGPEVAERLRQSRPSLEILFTSGYTDNAIVHHGVLDAGTHFLTKPFSVTDLTLKVRAVLDER